MNNILRWYQYIVSAVSLQAVTWAVIALLRNLLTPALNPLSGSIRYATDTMALQLAVIIIGLPIFLVHWLWAERSRGQEGEEAFELVRPLYIYFMMSAFLVPILTNSYGFIASTFRLLLDETLIIPSYSSQLPDKANLVYTGSAILVLTLLWLYHFKLAGTSYKSAPDAAPVSTIRRLYIYLFSAVGLAMTSSGTVSILRWLTAQVPQQAIGSGTKALITVLALLIIGIPLWILFWRKAQALFISGSDAEKSSLLRKFYLYLVIFLAVMAFVSACTIFLASIIRRLLSLEPQAGGGTILSVLIVSALIWVYHALVLREDTHRLPEGERQAALRRLYWYLVAGVGLMALLIGIAGVISLLISSSGQLIVSSQKEMLAWYAAALLAGLVVWIVPWAKIQGELHEPQPRGLAARLEPIRKLYLYFFLLLATLTFLGSTVFILHQLLSRLLGARTSAWNNNMSLAAAYALLAILIWVYHGFLLNQDRQFVDQARSDLAAQKNVVIVDDGDGSLGQMLFDRLCTDIPGIVLWPLFLNAVAVDGPNEGEEPLLPEQMIAQADLIVGPWTIISPYAAETKIDEDLQQAIAGSAASRLLIPRPVKGWVWSGVDQWDSETAVEQAAISVKQFMVGEEISLVRPRSAASIVLIALAVLLLFLLLFFLGVNSF